MTLFLGLPLKGELFLLYELLPKEKRDLFREELAELEHLSLLHLGKTLSSPLSLSDLELSGEHLLSLLKKLFPEEALDRSRFRLIAL